MEKQTHHIQALLKNKFDQYKDKGNELVKEYINMIQEIYQKIY